MSKKPTGRTGSLKSKLTVNGPRHQWEGIQFPNKKDDIEAMMMSRFVHSCKPLGLQYENVEQNAENHFDFSAQTPRGPVYIDLMEAIYQTELGNPYRSKKKMVKVGHYVIQLLSLILAKSEKYASKGNVPVHLLIYTTHWRFKFNEQVMRLLSLRLRSYPHIFEKIFYIHPKDEVSNETAILYPVRGDVFIGFDPILAEHHAYVIGDMSEARGNPDGTTTVTLDITEFFSE